MSESGGTAPRRARARRGPLSAVDEGQGSGITGQPAESRPAESLPTAAAAHPGDPLESEGTVPEAARAALSRVRAAARSAAPVPGSGSLTRSPRSGPARSRVRRAGARYSGPGPDERDPMTIAGAWSRMVSDNGWSAPLDVASLHGQWAQIVGAANAEHADPESFDLATGVLVIRTSSTAWAEQLRLMLPTLRTSIDAHVGIGVVRDIRITGPTPPRSRGKLRVRGRGPRDTYG